MTASRADLEARGHPLPPGVSTRDGTDGKRLGMRLDHSLASPPPRHGRNARSLFVYRTRYSLSSASLSTLTLARGGVFNGTLCIQMAPVHRGRICSAGSPTWLIQTLHHFLRDAHTSVDPDALAARRRCRRSLTLRHGRQRCFASNLRLPDVSVRTLCQAHQLHQMSHNSQNAPLH